MENIDSSENMVFTPRDMRGVVKKNGKSNKKIKFNKGMSGFSFSNEENSGSF
jgi:hypothetical protein